MSRDWAVEICMLAVEILGDEKGQFRTAKSVPKRNSASINAGLRPESLSRLK
jgi:hypothetical protein